MSEQGEAAGWRVFVHRRAEDGTIRQTTYFVAIPDKEEMRSAVCEQLKLEALQLVHCEPVSAEVLKEHRVKAGDIVEFMVMRTR